MQKAFFYLSCLFALASCTRPPINETRATEGALKNEPFFQQESRQNFARLGTGLRSDVTPPTFDVESYTLKGQFDWESLTLRATVFIKMKLLDVKATHVVLDSHVTKVSQVLMVSGGPLTFANEAGKLNIHLGNLAGRDSFVLAIDYEARANSLVEGALVATPHRKGDPVGGHTVGTFSEPIGVPEWMPCHNVAGDRSLFAAEFLMAPEDRLIANGDLLADEVSKGVRRMSYATSYTLPTYLMAFAVGSFQVENDNSGRVPLQIWHRKGLAVDSEGLFKAFHQFMDTFENLLVPYPFEKYALILMPGYTSGLEHAGITFQGEVRSSQSRVAHDLELSAHELAHQWFGDLVTVASWDDLWIKEGMATLLAQEAMRIYEDASKTGRLLARDFTPKAGEAIRDTEIAANDKYNSGPYQRGAWFYTQIRSLLGEKKFWGTLAEMLQKHRFGAIGTEALLEEFRGEAGDENIKRMKKALAAKALPKLEKPSLRGGKLLISLSDPEGSLLVPLDFQWHQRDGKTTTATLLVGEAISVVTTEGGLLTIDPQDRHPIFDFNLRGAANDKVLSPLMIPQNADTRAILSHMPAHHQNDALSLRRWKLDPQSFAALYDSWDSEHGKYLALQLGCELATDNSSEIAEWRTVILPRLKTPPEYGLPDPSTGNGLSYCRAVISDDHFQEGWSWFANSPELSGPKEPDLLLLALISTSAKNAFTYAKLLVEKGGTVRTQKMIVEMLSRHWDGKGKYETAGADLTKWKAWLREQLTHTEVGETLHEILDMLVDAKDKGSLPMIAEALRQSSYPAHQRQFVCAAHKISTGDKMSWKSFLSELGDISNFSDSLKRLLQDPKSCSREE